VINGGDGNDLINVSYGVDTITAGAGNDVIDINATSTAAVAQVTKSKDLDYVTGTDVTTAWGTGDIISITVNGFNYQSAKFSSTDTTVDTIDEVGAIFVTDFAASILAATSVTLTYDSTDDKFVLTGKSDGTAFTASLSTSDVSATPDTVASVTATTGNTTGVAALTVNSTIADFAVGDIINTEGISALGTAGYYEGSGSVTADTEYGLIVLTGASYASNALAEDAYTTAGSTASTTSVVVVYLNSATGKAVAFLDADIDTDGTTADTATFFTFDNITTLTGLATVMSTDSFVI
jgi:hypothetical protein